MSKVDRENVSGNTDEISLKEIILTIREWRGYLLSKWKVIIAAIILGGGLGLTYSFLNKPVYKAELSFALQEEKSGMGGLNSALGLAGQFGIDLSSGTTSDAFTGDNLLELMKSRAMIEKALLTTVVIKGERITLAEDYINFNKLRESWSDKEPELEKIHFLPGADRSKFTLKQDSLLGAFYNALVKNNVTVDKIDKKLSIIKLTINSPNELFSKYFAEILAKVVSDFYIQTKTGREAKNVAILQRQADSVRRMLNADISGVAITSDVNPNPNPSLQILRVPSERKQVDVEANTAILTELVKNLEISKMSLLQATPLIQVIDSPILPLEKKKIGKLQGIVLGSLVIGFFTVVFLLCSRYLKSL